MPIRAIEVAIIAEKKCTSQEFTIHSALEPLACKDGE